MKKHVVLIILAFMIAFFAFGGAIGCRDCDGDGFPESIGGCPAKPLARML